MKETLQKYQKQMIVFWKKQTKIVKAGAVISAAVIIIAAFWILFSRPDMVPLYTNLSPEEAGQIKANLDEKGIVSEVTNGGTTIMVPEEKADVLKIELAAEGIPQSGKIDYSFFGQNAGFGMTENEFSMLKQEAMQTELEQLISTIHGVESANVMITLPEDSIWVADQKGEAQASVVLDLEPGYELNPEQVRALYRLVAKSVPRLSMDNIVIMDEMFRSYELDESSGNSTLSVYEQQREIQEDIEQDLQNQITRMLTRLVGPGKVMVSVTTSIDFTKEKRIEHLVRPVDEEHMEGIAISVERIRETYSGENPNAGGVVGSGETDVPTYETETEEGPGEYERVEERINREVNRIKREIVESPYEIKDIGIQVMIEPPEPGNPASLPPQTIDDIEQVLATIIRTSLPEDGGEGLNETNIEEKIAVSVQTFHGNPEEKPSEKHALPIWLYVILGLLVAALAILLFLLWRKNKREDVAPEIDDAMRTSVSPSLTEQQETERDFERKELEKLAREEPEQFARLLRTWLSEE